MSNIVDRIIAARHDEERGEWACFRELATGTGFGHPGRYADLFALNCYPSKGFRAVVYEVKVSRADFKKEIEDMTKRAPWEKVAHECYFATTPGLVKIDEVPDGWGLIEVGEAVRVVKVARQRTPEPWSMAFCAALARRSADPAQKRVSAAAWKVEGKELDGTAFETLVRERARETKGPVQALALPPPPADPIADLLAYAARQCLGRDVTPERLYSELRNAMTIDRLKKALTHALSALENS